MKGHIVNCLLLLIPLIWISATFGVPTDYIIVFDIPNTTIYVDKNEMEKKVSSFAGAMYALANLKFNPRKAIEHDFFELLNSFGTQKGSAEWVIRDPEGKQLPELLVQWLVGNITSQQIIQQVKNYAEYDIFNAIAKSVFNNNFIAENSRIVSGAAECISRCAQLVGDSHLYLLGNWDRLSFELLERAPQLQKIFQHFPHDHLLPSGLTRQLLPRSTGPAFGMISSKAGVPLNHIIFISGMPYHIQAAKQLGIHTITFSGSLDALMRSIQAILNS